MNYCKSPAFNIFTKVVEKSNRYAKKAFMCTESNIFMLR